jgi:predicted nuclease of restriction endonuclease-like (RecB) superfamily
VLGLRDWWRAVPSGPFYAASALEHGWSRAVLVHHIEARTVERRGKALTNFEQHLFTF